MCRPKSFEPHHFFVAAQSHPPALYRCREFYANFTERALAKTGGESDEDKRPVEEVGNAVLNHK